LDACRRNISTLASTVGGRISISLSNLDRREESVERTTLFKDINPSYFTFQDAAMLDPQSSADL